MLRYLIYPLLFVACSSGSAGGSDDGVADAAAPDGDAAAELSTVDIEVLASSALLRGRSSAGLARDPTTGRTFLSGGFDSEGTRLKDVLEWTSTGWELIANDLPPEANHGFVFAPAHDGFLVFGSNQSIGTFLWSPDVGTTDLTLYCNDGCPLARVGHGMEYLPGSDAVVLVSGVGGAANASGDFLRQDSYLLVGDSDRWSTPSGAPPPARTDAAIAYDPKSDAIWLFGGQAGDALTPLNDLWRLDAQGWHLVQENVGGDDDARPKGRLGATLTYHPGVGKLILAGGLNQMGGFPEAQTLGYWSWDGESWKRLANGKNTDPTQADTQLDTWDHEHAAIYDPTLDAIVTVGGKKGYGQTRLLRLVP